MYGHDYNLLPIDSSGNLIPLQNLSDSRAGGLHPQLAGDLQRRLRGCRMACLSVDVRDDPLRRRQLDFGPHQRTAHRCRADSPARPSTAPFRSTRNRITPAVQFLIHANIKASFEYQFRPSQSVVIATNPLTGLPMAVNPFHTNTLVLGLEFAY